MPVASIRKKIEVNGLYVHSNPPRVLSLNSVNSNQIRHWIRLGDFDKLDQLVLDGKGSKLVGEFSPDRKVRAYLKSLPSFMSKIDLAHDAVSANSLSELKTLLSEDTGKKRLASSKDEAGVGLLHKAVYYDLPEIVHYLTQTYPYLLQQKDPDGRTPCHYCAACRNPQSMLRTLVNAGADSEVTDNKNHTPQYYIDHPVELELPQSAKMAHLGIQKKAKSDVIRPSNIRIWIHQKDIGKLQKVLWEGLGGKLKVETSSNPKVKRFLESVPYIMSLVKDIHEAAINNNVAELEKLTASPVPAIIVSSKDQNGVTPLHKAAGLSHLDVAKYILTKWPESISKCDNEGRTPLHYAATLKTDTEMYDFLVANGADEATLDNRQKTAAYYRNRPSDISSKLITAIPEAPRVANSSFPSTWDWSLLGNSNDPPPKEIKTKETVPPEAKPPTPISPKRDSPEPPKPESPEPATPDSINQQETAEVQDTPNEMVNDEEKTEPLPPKSDSPDVLNLEEDNEKSPPQDFAENEFESKPEESVEGEMNESKEDEDKHSERVIEGIVQGDFEELNNDGADRNLLSPSALEVKEMVESANMEQLAALVLNGDGERLIGQVSNNPELQVFLDNVPTYMGKIKKVHTAARAGSLRDLQASLDRRKFAIAKDKLSPNGATPLHTAIIFGNTSIVRYLAGRFPETVQVEDDFGRTPLHYAATIADNGHYYNLLLHLGANAKAQDKLGHMAEYYRNNSSELSHQSLLRDYGADGDVVSNAVEGRVSTGQPVDVPIFRTEEGRYLASSLGDPLIKGLSEVANKRPQDPIAYLATYLANFNSDPPHANPAAEEIEEVDVSSLSQEPYLEIRPPQTIDVVAVEPDEHSQSPELQTAFSSPNRDEHGQSMLHFAAARSHGRSALFQLLEETDINIGYRDELYRTARDVSIQAHLPDNTIEIDKWVVHIAARGDTDKLVELLLEGYDHILDIVDENNQTIIEIVGERSQPATVEFLQSILAFEEKRERVHHAIRLGDVDLVRELLTDENSSGSGKLLAMGKNSYGRSALHIAVLCLREEIADFIANSFPETLRIGDNLERTALHYAMGVENVESISKLLIKAGAKRVLKDLKGRQPTYYFMNKSDIIRLQEEETF